MISLKGVADFILADGVGPAREVAMRAKTNGDKGVDGQLWSISAGIALFRAVSIDVYHSTNNMPHVLRNLAPPVCGCANNVFNFIFKTRRVLEVIGHPSKTPFGNDFEYIVGHRVVKLVGRLNAG